MHSKLLVKIKKNILVRINSGYLSRLDSIISQINNLASNRFPFFLFVDFEMENPLLIKTKDLLKESVQVSFPTFTNITPLKTIKPENLIKNKKAPIIGDYQKGFDIVMENLLYGNSFLTNYTWCTEIETHQTLQEIFEMAHARYKIHFRNEWVCFSPESFVEIKDGNIFSFPMKGTIRADIPNAAQIILNDEKEIAEHYTIVDLIRNDLSKVSEKVCVEQFRYIEKIETCGGALLQVSSKIRGELHEDFHKTLGDILFALLPAGSVSGAPKSRTMEIIKQAENYKRGYYTGVAFYFDGENLDSCVLIRFIEKINNKFYYKSGGGITVYSRLEKEYQEVLDKIYVPVY